MRATPQPVITVAALLIVMGMNTTIAVAIVYATLRVQYIGCAR